MTNKQDSTSGPNDKESHKGDVADTNPIHDDTDKGKMQEKTPCLVWQIGKPTANLVGLQTTPKVVRQCWRREWQLWIATMRESVQGV